MEKDIFRADSIDLLVTLANHFFTDMLTKRDANTKAFTTLLHNYTLLVKCYDHL